MLPARGRGKQAAFDPFDGAQRVVRIETTRSSGAACLPKAAWRSRSGRSGGGKVLPPQAIRPRRAFQILEKPLTVVS